MSRPYKKGNPNPYASLLHKQIEELKIKLSKVCFERDELKKRLGIK